METSTDQTIAMRQNGQHEAKIPCPVLTALAFSDQKMALVSGPRQCGKTTLGRIWTDRLSEGRSGVSTRSASFECRVMRAARGEGSGAGMSMCTVRGMGLC